MIQRCTLCRLEPHHLFCGGDATADDDAAPARALQGGLEMAFQLHANSLYSHIHARHVFWETHCYLSQVPALESPDHDRVYLAYTQAVVAAQPPSALLLKVVGVVVRASLSALGRNVIADSSFRTAFPHHLSNPQHRGILQCCTHHRSQYSLDSGLPNL